MQTSCGRFEEQVTGGPVVTSPQLNSAKSVPCEPLLHDEDCHKATKTPEIPLQSCGRAEVQMLRGWFGPLGCLYLGDQAGGRFRNISFTSVTSLARKERRIDILFYYVREDRV